ncbi:MAG: hypothetical protein U9P14_01275, partial [Gemmatimonadota bacterium]|nr:hypothetical protein [Gemmatimonadota bacterium]
DGETAAALVSGLARASLLCVKLAILWLAAAWMTASTAPLKIVGALGYLLHPLEALRLPVKEFSFIVGLILRFFPDSASRIASIHSQLRMRQCLAGGPGRQKDSSLPSPFPPSPRLGLVIEAMVLYMHYSLHQAEVLARNLMARGYNPFQAHRGRRLSSPGAWELGLALFSVAVIIAAAAWF